jgi:hypothetical protein
VENRPLEKLVLPVGNRFASGSQADSGRVVARDTTRLPEPLRSMLSVRAVTAIAEPLHEGGGSTCSRCHGG